MNLTRQKKRERLLPLEMAPMIDIVFQLLIFFLATAQLAEVSRAELDLPQEAGESAEVGEEAGLVVNILANGELLIDENVLSDEQFAVMVEELVLELDSDRLARLRPLIRADRSAEAGRLNRVLTLLQRSGIPAVRIATSPGGNS